MENMTEQQMRDRIKEIDREREKLRKEKEEYENYLYQQEKLRELTDHERFIGKCYTADKPNTEFGHVKAFKILEIINNKERYARCLVLINGYEHSCWPIHGIQKMVLPLWCKSRAGFLTRASDPDVIELFKEMPEEEFNDMYAVWDEMIKEDIAERD